MYIEPCTEHTVQCRICMTALVSSSQVLDAFVSVIAHPGGSGGTESHKQVVVDACTYPRLDGLGPNSRISRWHVQQQARYIRSIYEVRSTYLHIT